MQANNYFEHTAPDGTTGWYFIGLTGYDYLTAGENLAASNEDASAVVNGWMNSPGHRANLLNPKFTEVDTVLYLSRSIWNTKTCILLWLFMVSL